MKTFPAIIHKIRHSFSVIIKHLVLLSLLVLTLFPLFFMFNASFKHREEFLGNVMGLPHNPTLQNYINILQRSNLTTMFLNSIILTACSVFLCTIIAVITAYAFANLEFYGRDFLFNLITPLMVIPPIVMIIPLFVFMSKVNLVNNLWGPIVIYSGLMLPFTIYLLRNFFITIPNEIQEAAEIDGCSTFQILIKIYFPLSRPALVTVIIVNTVWVWNELLIALVFLQKEELRTLIVGITTSLQKRFTLDVPLLMAGLAIATIPMILLYLVGQNALVRGLVSGYEK